jgi:hypothetical protein
MSWMVCNPSPFAAKFAPLTKPRSPLPMGEESVGQRLDTLSHRERALSLGEAKPNLGEKGEGLKPLEGRHAMTGKKQ